MLRRFLVEYSIWFFGDILLIPAAAFLVGLILGWWSR